MKEASEDMPQLPLIGGEEEAIEVARVKGDAFYLAAYRLRVMHETLGEFYTREFSEKKNQRERTLQGDIAWTLFNEQFRVFMGMDSGLPFLGDLMRYGQHAGKHCEDVAMAVLFSRADLPIPELGAEEPVDVMLLRVAQLFRVLFRRICDWLEAFQHLDTYRLYANAPVLFQPNAIGRDLAQLGFLHRVFPWLDADTQTAWLADYEELAAQHASTPRWKIVEEARTTNRTGAPKHPLIDQATIMLWPLMKQHNWTYRDLITVLAQVLPEHRGYPCDREQSMAAYCPNVLGLRKTGRPGRSRTGEGLPGLALARLIFSS
jgi:hypothetical protein